MNSVIYVYSSLDTAKEMMALRPDLDNASRGFSGRSLHLIFTGKRSALMHYKTILHGVSVMRCSLVEIEPIQPLDIDEMRQYQGRVRGAKDYTMFKSKIPEDAWEQLKDYAAKDIAVEKTWIDAIDKDFEHSWLGVAIFVLAGIGLLITLWLSI